MKILFVCTSRFVCGGIQYHLLDLAGEFRKSGVSVSFLAREEGTFKDSLSNEGFTVYTVNREGRRKMSSPMQAIRAMKTEKPDIISVNREHDIIFTYYVLKMIKPFLKKLPKLAAVIHTPTGRKLPMLKNYDGLIYVSKYTRDVSLNNGRKITSNSEIIYHGIRRWDENEESQFDRNRERRFFKDRIFPIIGMVGNIWKNQEELIDVARFLVDEYPKITIAVVGRGSYGHIREMANRYGFSDNFIFTGAIERSVIPDVFFDFDVSVSTHKNEGFGIVHIESLMSYTPVVAYNIGGHVELLEQGGGILVEGDAYEFAKAVKLLLDDDELRKNLGMSGRKLVEEKFTLEKMYRKHKDYYERLMEH